MAAIRVLPPEVVARIAAGEVIERPASVLKELVENSLDAGATRVIVALEEGGKALIRVSDNGCGIAREDLPLAFLSHATSKLDESHFAADLFGIDTLGFRGEALASIGSVAMVSLLSRAPGSEHAWEYRPGDPEPRPAAREIGTTVEVRNLFYNVPARRKFLRSGATELSHAIQVFTRLAISFPGVGFELTHGEKQLFLLPPSGDLRERLGQILGRETLEDLVEVRADTGGLPSLRGFVCDPRLSRKDAREQHFFVNGRWVRDRMLAHALREAYEGLLVTGSQPLAYLFLEVAPEEVDVNVHPTKAEVRFREPSQIYRMVQAGVREALAGIGFRGATSPSLGTPAAAPQGYASRPRSSLERAFQEFLARPPRERLSGAHWRRPSSKAGGAGVGDAPVSVGEELAGGEGGTRGVGPELEAPSQRLRAFQVLESYIVVEASEGLAIVDQHAFHEKIIYEEVLESLRAGPLERQQLLFPHVVDVPPELMLFAERAAELLAPLGFAIEPFGKSSLAVHSSPAILERETGSTDLSAIVGGVLEALREESIGEWSSASAALDAALRRVAAEIACRRAVKAGAKLKDAEIEALISRGMRALDPGHCPHGRPSVVFFSREDIEKQFDRR